MTVLAYSGGFAYPSFLWRTGARILAQSSPADTRVPISSLRRLEWALLKSGGDACLQIENEDQPHGDVRLVAGESYAIARAVAFDRAADPLSLSVPVPGPPVVR